MNDDFTPKDESKATVPPISAEEFDAMFDAGEDISAYVDWDKGVMVAPGELSPGQKLSMQLLAAAESDATSQNQTTEEGPPLNISLPFWAYAQLQYEAARQGVSREKLAQLLIVQRLDKEKVLS